MTKLKCISQNEQPIPIPDHDDKGLESQIIVYRSGSIQDVQLSVDIDHAHVGDLEVQVIAPNGSQVSLHNRSGGDASNLKTTYSGEIFEDLIGTVEQRTSVINNMSRWKIFGRQNSIGHWPSW